MCVSLATAIIMAFVCALREKLSLSTDAIFARAHLFNSPVPLAADWYGRERAINQLLHCVCVAQSSAAARLIFPILYFVYFQPVNFSFPDSSVDHSIGRIPARACPIVIAYLILAVAFFLSDFIEMQSLWTAIFIFAKYFSNDVE